MHKGRNQCDDAPRVVLDLTEPDSTEFESWSKLIPRSSDEDGAGKLVPPETCRSDLPR